MTYDAAQVRSWYDAYEDREWRRLEETLHGRAKYAIHRRLLLDAIEPGMRVADIGCGPGRFAIDATEAGASVTLIDLSPEMLSQARERLAEAGVEAEAFIEADVRDLAPVGTASFDLTVCYGGAISYCYDRYMDALAELARVTRPGGRLLVSVMTLVGVMRLIGSLDAVEFVGDWPTHMPDVDWDADEVVLTTPGSPEWHLPLALFTAASLQSSLESLDLEVERTAVANPVTALGQELPKIGASPEAAQRLIDLEVALSDRPGLRDGGEHLLALARKR